MSEMGEVRVRRVRAGDQAAARALILAGLAEHWGALDPTLNPDLDDIAATYGAGVFLVAVADEDGAERIVGTRALQPVDAMTGQIVRMSVARAARRQEVGRQILDALLAEARARGMRRIVLETTANWADAIAFYRCAGLRSRITRGAMSTLRWSSKPLPPSLSSSVALSPFRFIAHSYLSAVMGLRPAARLAG